jgi:hypothetical protein
MLLRSSGCAGFAVGGMGFGALAGFVGPALGALGSAGRVLVGTRDEGRAEGVSVGVAAALGVGWASIVGTALSTGGRSFRPGGKVIEPAAGAVATAPRFV